MDTDRETSSRQKRIKSLVGHEGWKHVREMFAERVLSLQSIGEVADILESGNAQELLFKVSVKKEVAEELFNFLREIEGTAAQAEELPAPEKTHIIRKE